ncbi:MAG TPA: hypothetical protein VIU40_14285 [Geobacteraceae bacterium]
MATLTRRYRREFPAYKYAVTTEGSHREMARLLEQYGGLPQGTESLNGVPAEVLEKAVGAFVAYFGLTEGVVGNLRRSGSIPAEADPKPRTLDMEVPW